MTPRGEDVPRSRSRVYLRRAENLARTMEWALGERNPDGVATNAVQCGIAAGDAYTVWWLGQRSRGRDHREVITLVNQCPSPKAAGVSKYLQRLLDKKSEVEYQQREVRFPEAESLAGHARKLLELVRSDCAAPLD